MRSAQVKSRALPIGVRVEIARRTGRWLARAPGEGMCVVGRFGRSAKRGPSALLAPPPLKLLTRELLGRKGTCKGQTALTFIKACLFFFKRLHSLRATAFPSGFDLSNELLAQASQWRVLRGERKWPRAVRNVCVWWKQKGDRRLRPSR